jgi:hypothetical protein
MSDKFSKIGVAKIGVVTLKNIGICKRCCGCANEPIYGGVLREENRGQVLLFAILLLVLTMIRAFES